MSSPVISNPNASASESVAVVDSGTVVLFLSLFSGMVSIPRACARESAADLLLELLAESFWFATGGVDVTFDCLPELVEFCLAGIGGGEGDSLAGEVGVGEGVGGCCVWEGEEEGGGLVTVFSGRESCCEVETTVGRAVGEEGETEVICGALI